VPDGFLRAFQHRHAAAWACGVTQADEHNARGTSLQEAFARPHAESRTVLRFLCDLPHCPCSRVRADAVANALGDGFLSRKSRGEKWRRGLCARGNKAISFGWRIALEEAFAKALVGRLDARNFDDIMPMLRS